MTGEQRSPVLPDVPTAAELGIRGLEGVYTWLGLLGPARLPAPVLEKLSAEVVRILRAPGTEKRIRNDGYILVANTPEQFRGEIQSETATWAKVIRERGIKAQ